MEQMQNTPILELPLSTPDQATFDRVWNRVMGQPGQMPEQGATRTTESVPTTEMTVPTVPQETVPARPEPVIPQNVFPAPLEPILPRNMSPALRASEAPMQYDLVCLGTSSMQYVPLLREMMDGAYGLWNAYRVMARQAQGMSARQVRALAEDQQRILRQLGAVYFLITGERFLYAARSAPPSGPLNSVLREMFAREQRWRQAYAQAICQVEDPCLVTLFDELAEKSELHMDAIRRILEGL